MAWFKCVDILVFVWLEPSRMLLMEQRYDGNPCCWKFSVEHTVLNVVLFCFFCCGCSLSLHEKIKLLYTCLLSITVPFNQRLDGTCVKIQLYFNYSTVIIVTLRLLILINKHVWQTDTTGQSIIHRVTILAPKNSSWPCFSFVMSLYNAPLFFERLTNPRNPTTSIAYTLGGLVVSSSAHSHLVTFSYSIRALSQMMVTSRFNAADAGKIVETMWQLCIITIVVFY